MRIGIDARLWSQTGVGRYIRSLFHYLYLLDKENDYIWFFRKNEYEAIDLPTSRWKKVLADIRWHTFQEQVALPRIFYKENLDLLHFPYFSFPITYRGKFVITIHDLIFDHYKSGKSSTLPYPLYLLKKIGYHYVLRKSVEKAEKIITLSESSKKEIIDHYQSNPNKIIVTYESGNLEIDRQAKRTLGNDVEKRQLKPFILYVGNAHPHKNVETLVDTMLLLRTQRPELKLVLIGSDKFFFPKIQQYIMRKNLQNNIIVVGEVPNDLLTQWYKNAECFVTASLMEGFGIPPLEAMSVGCPVIVSDIPVFHEIYQYAATYFDPHDPEDIAETITKTLANNKMLQDKIAKGYKMSSTYSWEKMTKETLAVYKEIL